MDWYYWVIILGVLVVFYVVMIVKQKRQEKQSTEMLNSFKVGDKVVTHIGIYGKIKRIYNTTYGKVCVLEIGDKNKVDVELDMRYIAAKDEKTLEPETKQVETTQKKAEIEQPPKETQQEKQDEKSEEVIVEEDKSSENK